MRLERRARMPNEGEREAYIASRIQEAMIHPKALILGAIGAMCSSPNESANMASDKDLGLSTEEIQYARWVALFKKGKTRKEFLKGLLEALQIHGIQGEEAMEVKRGKGFFEIKTAPLIEKFVKDLYKHGVRFTDGANTLQDKDFGGRVKYSISWRGFPEITVRHPAGGDWPFHAR